MAFRKICWVLFAVLVAILIILWRTYIIGNCPVCDWNRLQWIAAMCVILAFIFAGICGTSKNK
jgi:uncharacterized protein with PQ loop repeat